MAACSALPSYRRITPHLRQGWEKTSNAQPGKLSKKVFVLREYHTKNSSALNVVKIDKILDHA